MAMVEVGSRFPAGYERRGSRGGVRARGNDILFARITPCLENGKLAQLPTDAPPTGGSTEFIVVRPGPEVDPGFVYYWCMSPDVRKRAEAMMSGTTGRMRLSADDLAGLTIEYPPLDEQRRIVDLLEGHLSRLDAGLFGLREAKRKQDVLWLSALSGLVRGVRSGEAHPLGAIASTALGKMLDAKKQQGKPYPYLRNINVRWREFDLSDVQTTLLTDDDVQRFDVRPGDVMACEGGEPGRCAVWQRGPGEVFFQKAIHRIRVRSNDEVLPDFLALMIEEAVRSGRCDHLFTGTTIKHLPQEKLRTIPVTVPTLLDQRTITRKAAEILEGCDRMRIEVDKLTGRSDTLRRSLLSAAFSGRLTRGREHLDTEELVSP